MIISMLGSFISFRALFALICRILSLIARENLEKILRIKISYPTGSAVKMVFGDFIYKYFG